MCSSNSVTKHISWRLKLYLTRRIHLFFPLDVINNDTKMLIILTIYFWTLKKQYVHSIKKLIVWHAKTKRIMKWNMPQIKQKNGVIKESNLFTMLVGRRLPSDSCRKLRASAPAWARPIPSVGKAFRHSAKPLTRPIVGTVCSLCTFTFKVCTFSASIKQTKTDLLTCKHGRDYKIKHVKINRVNLLK